MKYLFPFFTSVILSVMLITSHILIERDMDRLTSGVAKLVKDQQVDVTQIKNDVIQEVELTRRGAESAAGASKSAESAAKSAESAALAAKRATQNTASTIASKVVTTTDKVKVIQKEKKLDKEIKKVQSSKHPGVWPF